MLQLKQLRLVSIVCLIAGLIIIAKTNNFATSLASTSDRNENEEVKVYAQVVSGSDEKLAGQPLAEEWLVRSANQLGSPYAWKHTDWIEVTKNKQEIYQSMMGGRLIEIQLLPKKRPDQITVEITGFKIGAVPRWVTLQSHDGVKELIKLTNYPGERNVFLAFCLGHGSN